MQQRIVRYVDNGQELQATVLFQYEGLALIKPFGLNHSGQPRGVHLIPINHFLADV